MHRLSLLILALLAPAMAQATDTLQTSRISIDGARALIDQAVRLASERKLRMCIAVTDANGDLVAFERMDGAIPGCVDSSIAKARSSARFGVATANFFQRAREENLPLGFVPGIVPAAGGAPLRWNDAVIGAVGVSGGNVETETALAADAAAAFPAKASTPNPD